MASSNTLYWKRVGHVEVENSAGKMVSYAGFDFKFQVESIGDIYQEFTVGILGLSMETVSDLTVWDITKSATKPRRIAVYAGYEHTGESLVASGYVWYAMPTNPPEMWINFSCMRYLKDEKLTDSEIVFRDMTRKEVFNEVASVLGLRPDYRCDDGGEEQPTFSIGKGTPKASIARTVAKLFDKIIYENAGLLICTDTHPETKKPDKAKLLSADTGLISVGNIDIKGGRFTTRMRNDIGLMEWIRLQSILVPSANGSYCVISKKISGHLRGDQWQTEFNCIRGR